MCYLKRFIKAQSVAKYGAGFAFCVALALFLQICATSGVGAQTLKFVAFGDSLVAGYGLPEHEGFSQQLQVRLAAALAARAATNPAGAHKQVEVINAGLSGNTSAGGLARFDWSVPEEADAIMIALGGNDLLRGLQPENMQANLEAIILRAKARNLKILLVGQYAAPNMGADYARRFNAVFPHLADKHDLPLYPFFLEHVAGVADLNQPDGIHPNKQGVAVMVDHILPFIIALLEDDSAR